RNIQSIRQPKFGMAVEHRTRAGDRDDPRKQPIAQRAHARHFAQALPSERARGAQTGREQRALRPRAAPGLVATAVHQRLEYYPCPNVQGTDALRRTQFMSGDREQIITKLIRAHADLPRALRRVDMKDDTARMRQVGELADRLDRPRLVVRM